MASNFTLFSEAFDCNTDVAFAWMKAEYNRRCHDDEDVGFEIEYDDTRRLVIVFAEESGDIEKVADFIQQALKKFSPNGCWAITYAETCSSPRPGEFNGGAVFVTAEKIEYMNTYTWAKQKMEEFLGHEEKTEGPQGDQG